MGKKLSSNEIEKVAEKIRKKYNDIIVSYMLNPRIKNGFEERYSEIKNRGFDPLRFFNDEIKALTEIEQKEKEKISKAAKSINIESDKNKDNEADKRTFADKVIEEMHKKLEKYPTLFIHEDANKEIEKLFGALIDFDKNKWKVYESIAKKYRSNTYDLPYDLEKMLNNFVRIYSGDVTVRLVQYKNMLISPFSRTNNIAREEKNCILECAYLIKLLIDAANRLIDFSIILQDEKAKLLNIVNYLDTMVEDFRLKDLLAFGIKR